MGKCRRNPRKAWSPPGSPSGATRGRRVRFSENQKKIIVPFAFLIIRTMPNNFAFDLYSFWSDQKRQHDRAHRSSSTPAGRYRRHRLTAATNSGVLWQNRRAVIITWTYSTRPLKNLPRLCCEQGERPSSSFTPAAAPLFDSRCFGACKSYRPIPHTCGFLANSPTLSIRMSNFKLIGLCSPSPFVWSRCRLPPLGHPRCDRCRSSLFNNIQGLGEYPGGPGLPVRASPWPGSSSACMHLDAETTTARSRLPRCSGPFIAQDHKPRVRKRVWYILPFDCEPIRGTVRRRRRQTWPRGHVACSRQSLVTFPAN